MYACFPKENFFSKYLKQKEYIRLLKKMQFCENGYIRLTQKIQNRQKSFDK